MKWLGKHTDMPAALGTIYLALFDAVPNDDGTGATECSAGNYSRRAITTGASGTGAGSEFSGPGISDGSIYNTSNIDFPICSGADWGLVAGWALFDAPTGGNMLVRGDVNPTANVTVGYLFRFEAGDWLIKLD